MLEISKEEERTLHKILTILYLYNKYELWIYQLQNESSVQYARGLAIALLFWE